MSSPALLTVKRNITPTDDVDWDLEITDGKEKINASLAYTDDFAGFMTRLPQIGSAHPDIEQLPLKKIKAKREPGDMIRVTLLYEANDIGENQYPGRNKGKIKRYTFEPTPGEEPILTFHKLSPLLDNSKEALSELVNSSRTKDDFAKAVTAIGSDPLALFAVEKIRKGIDAYRASGLIWVERFTTKNLSDMEPHKFNTIQTPPGDPPAVPTGWNWLYIPGSATPNDDGKTWDLERKWELSLPGGWDEWFYGAETEEVEE